MNISFVLLKFLDDNLDDKIRSCKSLEKLIPFNHKINLEYFFEYSLDMNIHPIDFFIRVKENKLIMKKNKNLIENSLNHSLEKSKTYEYCLLYNLSYLIKNYPKVINDINLNLDFNLEFLEKIYSNYKIKILN